MMYKILQYLYKKDESGVVEALTCKSYRDYLPIHLLLMNHRKIELSTLKQAFNVV
jgi:hypothetical protein